MSDESKSRYKEAGRFVAETAIISIIIIGIPFLISGVWPPFVSVISDSMEPTMNRGDMVFIVENDRFSDESDINGISVGNKENNGDVIVYYPNGETDSTPVIHRAVIYAEEGDNWVEEANSTYLTSSSCAFTENCPAPHDGYITLGDANNRYDQAVELSSPVKEEWIHGKSQLKVPFVGWVRVLLGS